MSGTTRGCRGDRRVILAFSKISKSLLLVVARFFHSLHRSGTSVNVAQSQINLEPSCGDGGQGQRQ
jgi:hypothetical protein